MTTPEDLLRKLGAETSVDPDAVARVEQRLLGRDSAIDALLRTHPGAAYGAETRVEARLRKSIGVRERVPTWVRLLPAAGSVAAAAAVAAAVTGVMVSSHGEPEQVAISGALQSPTSWASLAPASGVAITYEGTGAMGGTGRAPRIAWEAGTIHVEVEHGAGIDLRVETREAEVRVVGTGFSVTRDAFGTRVEVRHGRVAVHCEGADEDRFIDAGASAVCVPRSAAGLLARAEAQHEAGAPAAEVLRTLDDAVGAGGDAATVDEVLAVRALRRAEAGLVTDSLADARVVLGHSGSPREHEMRQLAANQALRAEGCTSAMGHLRDLALSGDAEAARWVAACEADPAAADGLRLGR